MNKKQEYRNFIIELALLFQLHTYVEIGAGLSIIRKVYDEHDGWINKRILWQDQE